MKKTSGIFVKINYKIDRSFKEGIKENSHKNKKGLFDKYLLCGGKYNKDGVTMIFQAENLKEAEEIINNNPFQKASFYSFEILSKNYIALNS
ncbi:hypothetical protein [Clostridium sp. 'White wine YQ']|uniref:hypothetical protein n=1 Tax=Clostridium sp. 'White wine YQ' TaxID=3027474 RepID=UPI0023650468|nr:hypothetical protein [Clostridium sp. 'White wine YQ']MDD7795142.1 hypothetical protein [Clostridium sp. 'White wine YQ']